MTVTYQVGVRVMSSAGSQYTATVLADHERDLIPKIRKVLKDARWMMRDGEAKRKPSKKQEERDG